MADDFSHAVAFVRVTGKVERTFGHGATYDATPHVPSNTRHLIRGQTCVWFNESRTREAIPLASPR